MSKNQNRRSAIGQEVVEGKAAPNAPEAAPERDTTASSGRARAERHKYPVPEGGLTEWPSDYNTGKHKPLSRRDFKDETVWLLHQADVYERRAKSYRNEAETIKKFGPGANTNKIKKLQKMQNELAELQAALAAQGVDVSSLLK